MNTVFIYALKCPTTGVIRYVGKTTNLRRRFQDHLTIKSKCHRKSWIQHLQVLGLKPVLEVLDEVSEEHWQQWEVAYIEYFREQGCDLVNGNSGGVGGHIPTAEMRARNRLARLGKKLSPEHRAKISAGNLGREVTFETRKKISSAHFGKKLSAERRTQMRAGWQARRERLQNSI